MQATCAVVVTALVAKSDSAAYLRSVKPSCLAMAMLTSQAQMVQGQSPIFVSMVVGRCSSQSDISYNPFQYRSFSAINRGLSLCLIVSQILWLGQSYCNMSYAQTASETCSATLFKSSVVGQQRSCMFIRVRRIFSWRSDKLYEMCDPGHASVSVTAVALQKGNPQRKLNMFSFITDCPPPLVLTPACPTVPMMKAQPHSRNSVHSSVHSQNAAETVMQIRAPPHISNTSTWW